MKLFGIHWLRSSEYFNFWPLYKREVNSLWGDFTIPQFPNSSKTSYHDWKDILNKYSLESYDMVITHSMWAPMILQYMKEQQQYIKSLCMVSPVLSSDLSSERIREDISHNLSWLDSISDLLITSSKLSKQVSVIIWENDKVVDKEGTISLLEASWIPVDIVAWRQHFLKVFGYQDISSRVNALLKTKV